MAPGVLAAPRPAIVSGARAPHRAPASPAPGEPRGRLLGAGGLRRSARAAAGGEDPAPLAPGAACLTRSRARSRPSLSLSLCLCLSSPGGGGGRRSSAGGGAGVG